MEKALYEYHDFSSIHFLKLVPEKAAECEENQLTLSELIIQFEKEFPAEMLCVLGATSLTQLENPIEIYSKEITGLIQIDWEVFSLQHLKHYVFDSATAINKNLITLNAPHTIVSIPQGALENFSGYGFIAEPNKHYEVSNDNYLPKAA